MMNAQLLALVAKYPKLAQLGPMAHLKANQLNVQHLERLADAFGVQIPVSAEILDALVALLKGHDINAVADLIQSPESLNDLVVFFTSGFKGLHKLHSEVEGEESEFSEDASLLYIS